MPLTFVPEGNRSLPQDLLQEKLKNKGRSHLKIYGQCACCGGNIIDDPELGRSCEDCERMPLTFSCC
jgi:hypothetical protein